MIWNNTSVIFCLTSIYVYIYVYIKHSVSLLTTEIKSKIKNTNLVCYVEKHSWCFEDRLLMRSITVPTSPSNWEQAASRKYTVFWLSVLVQLAAGFHLLFSNHCCLLSSLSDGLFSFSVRVSAQMCPLSSATVSLAQLHAFPHSDKSHCPLQTLCMSPTWIWRGVSVACTRWNFSRWMQVSTGGLVFNTFTRGFPQMFCTDFSWTILVSSHLLN